MTDRDTMKGSDMMKFLFMFLFGVVASAALNLRFADVEAHPTTGNCDRQYVSQTESLRSIANSLVTIKGTLSSIERKMK